MIQNEPFLPMKLASKDGGTGLTPAIPPGLRAVSVKVNEVIGVAGYVLPGTRVDVVATVSPTQNQADMTTKVILTNVEVLAAGTKIERTTDKDKPIPVTVVTHARGSGTGRAPDAGEHRRQDSARASQPARPEHAGHQGRQALGPAGRRRRRRRRRSRRVGTPEHAPVAAPRGPEPMTVEIIRGDKRAREVVREQ